jgi:uncharacterized membrane protein YqhA
VQIRWNNIIALILLVLALILLVKLLPAMVVFLASMKDIGPGHTTDEKTIGLIALGLVGVLLVAVVRILTSNNSK